MSTKIRWTPRKDNFIRHAATVTIKGVMQLDARKEGRGRTKKQERELCYQQDSSRTCIRLRELILYWIVKRSFT